MKKIYLIIIISMIFGLNCYAESKSNPASYFEYEKFEPRRLRPEYGMYDEEIKITGYVGLSETVVIPEIIDGCPVTVIGEEAFANDNSIKSITIPSTVYKIEKKAFFYCTNLTEAYLSLAPIASIQGHFYFLKGYPAVIEGAFCGCTSLKTVIIESGISLNMDLGVFNNCPKLESIVLPKNINIVEPSARADDYSSWLFYGCNKLKVINYRGDKGDNYSLFPEDNRDFQNAIKRGLVVNYNYIGE